MSNLGRSHHNAPVRASRPRRLHSGVAQAGVACPIGDIAVPSFSSRLGCSVKDMDWTQPEMLARPLGLDFAMMITNIGIFLVFTGVLNSFFYAPLRDAINTRNQNLEATFTEAESLKKEMGELRTSYEARLAQTEADAREQIQAQIREAQHLRTTLMAEAAARADELVRKAEIDIEAEKQRAMSEIRGRVVDLTLNATERLIGENVDSKVNRKLVDEFIDKMAVTSAVMAEHAVSKRYALALFNIALKNDVITSVADDLRAISGLMENDPAFREFVLSPTVSRDEKTQIIEKLFSDRVTILTMYMLRLLLRRRREAEIEGIQFEYEALRRDHGKAVLVTYSSAEELPDDQRKKLITKTETLTGRSVDPLFVVEPTLMGGVKIEYDNFMLDGTVRGNLEKLRERLRYDLFKNV